MRLLETRQKREAADEERRRADRAEAEAAERERAAKARLAEEAYEQQLQVRPRDMPLCSCSLGSTGLALQPCRTGVAQPVPKL